MDTKEASVWFQDLQEQLCDKIEELDTSSKMISPNKTTREGWFQQHRVMYGDIVEKGTVNFSHVTGEFKEEFAKQIPGTEQSRK